MKGVGKESITLSMELAKIQCYEFESFEDNYSLTISKQGCRSLIPRESLYRALKHSVRQQKRDLNFKKDQTASANDNKLSLELQISDSLRQLVNTHLENRPSSHFTKNSSPARGKKLTSSKQLAWNLYTVSHKVLENTKQPNSSSFSTYFMISVTDANLLTHAEM